MFENWGLPAWRFQINLSLFKSEAGQKRRRLLPSHFVLVKIVKVIIMKHAEGERNLAGMFPEQTINYLQASGQFMVIYGFLPF